MNTQRFLLSTALSTAFLFGLSRGAFAQTTIDTESTTPVATSTSGDVTIGTAGSITLTNEGPAIILDSDNDVTTSGTILIEDVDNATGIEVVGGNTGNLTIGSSVRLLDTTEFTDTDNDRVIDGPFANGSGRTGVLISGASPFVGNIEFETNGSVITEGADSFGIRLTESAGITGDLLTAGLIEITGANGVGVGIEGNIIGNLANGARINARGEGVEAINVSGDIDGAFSHTGFISNTGYRFTTRPNSSGRELLDEEDLRQAGNAIAISGNVTGGVNFDQVLSTTTNEDGITLTSIVSTPSISQFGSAAAVLIDGNGTPIAIGRVSNITDTTDENFDANQLFAFVNDGTISSTGVYDDINSTTLEVRDANLEGGIRNLGVMTASGFRSGEDGSTDVDGQIGEATVIILGNGAIVDQINNSGQITAQVQETTDTIFEDTGNVQGARTISVTAINIEDGASIDSLVNSNFISATATGREAIVYAIRDASGTLSQITNTGTIAALATNSDTTDQQATNFTTVALDLSANTSGVQITQSLAEDSDPDDSITPPSPNIFGDILLGSGDDNITSSAGIIVGGIDFGAGSDSLSLSNGTIYTGPLSNSEGDLTISATGGSRLINTNSDTLLVADATFDETSVYSPTLDGATGNASTLSASGTVSFAEGASIAPVLNNIIGTENTVFRVADAANLAIGGDVSALAGTDSPFLYNTTYSIDPNDPNALLITVDLRDANELGLDSVQSASFTSAFEALGTNSALGNAFVNISDGAEFNQAFNQLLPEFAAAARQFIIANVDGATGAVASHLDNVRRSQDRPGGAWIQEFAYFADRDLAGLSEQYRGSGFGFTAGLDSALGPFHAVGISAGFASTEIESVADQDDPLDVLSLQLNAYAGLQTGNLGFEAIAGFGYDDYESERKINVGDFVSTSDGDWSGTHYNGSLRAGYDVKISDKFWMRPAVSLDYLSINENAYTESGDVGIALDIDSRTSESGSATAMLNFGGHFMGKRTWVRPGLRVGYRNEFIGDGVLTTGRFAGLTTPFALEAEEFPSSGFLLGLTIAAGSEYSSFSLDLDSDIRDGFIRHTGRIVLRLLF